MRQRADVCWKGRLLECSRAATMAFAICGAAAAGAASSGGPFAIDSSVIAAGGSTLTGGTFQISGTLGQAGATRLSGSAFSLYAGFWTPEGPASDRIFSNGFDP